jgi:hypothetical protein
MNARIRKIWPLAATIAVALGATGCGQTAGSRGPALAGVPLTGGTRVVFHVRRCDRGANAYCAIQLVVVGNHYRSSTALLDSERRHLKAIGWGMANADTGDEHAADSPGHELRLTYATAALDLKDIDLGWVQRSPMLGRSLSRVMFDRSSALSLMLEKGSS